VKWSRTPRMPCAGYAHLCICPMAMEQRQAVTQVGVLTACVHTRVGPVARVYREERDQSLGAPGSAWQSDLLDPDAAMSR
jgi:hypothetical protein